MPNIKGKITNANTYCEWALSREWNLVKCIQTPPLIWDQTFLFACIFLEQTGQAPPPAKMSGFALTPHLEIPGATTVEYFSGRSRIVPGP